jgi:hypothetical protein
MTGSVRAQSCETSDGDQGVGVFGYYDETCINGGLGCWNSECRYCKKDVTPQSSAFASCPSDPPTNWVSSPVTGPVASPVASPVTSPETSPVESPFSLPVPTPTFTKFSPTPQSGDVLFYDDFAR